MEHAQSISKIVDGTRNTKILVVGDVMLDQYIHGSHAGQSPEAPVPVIRHQSSFSRPGGAANVALSLSSMGAQTTLIGVCGDDIYGRELQSLLQPEENLFSDIYGSADRRTTRKTRVIADKEHVLRYDEEDRHLLTPVEFEAIRPAIARTLETTDLVILQDYNKGTLTPELIRETISACQKRGIPVLVDPKRQHIESYRGATLLKPNEKELYEIAADRAISCTSLLETASEIYRSLDLQYLLVTRGAQGALLITTDGVTRYAAEQIELVDVCGAGDAVISMMSLAMCQGIPISSATRLGLHAAAVCCQHLGVYRMRASDFS